MDVEIFNFELPQERIALRPVNPRDTAKLLQVHDEKITDHSVSDLPVILRRGDVLVVNQTEVIKASITGTRAARERGGGSDVRVQINLHQKTSPNEWRAFVRPAKRLRDGDIVHISPALFAKVVDKRPGGDVGLLFNLTDEELMNAIEGEGEMPLPPYIGKMRDVDKRDETDYQTVYAAEKGSVAAPTAGLHFTDDLLGSLGKSGVQIENITLHVGAGTFLPVSHENTDDHVMHAEWYSISEPVADRINAAKKAGRRIIAVGTTSLRALESSAADTGKVDARSQETSIFITPGYQFRVIDGLMTNFHLPKSTLFMLVCALAGIENMKAAYKHAIENAYRFYSYGDSSLLWKASQ